MESLTVLFGFVAVVTLLLVLSALRWTRNRMARVVILLLFASGVWVLDHLRTSAHIADCLAAGHTNCLPLELRHGSHR